MAVPKSKTVRRSGSARKGKTRLTSTLTTAFFDDPAPVLPKGVSGIKLKVPDDATKAIVGSPKRIKALLQGYGYALAKSHAVGRRVSFRVDVDPEGDTVVTPVEEPLTAPAPQAIDVEARDPDLEAALAAARDRGRLRAAEILNSDDMLSAVDFAKLLGTTRVTVNTKRQNGQVLGLDGAKRGFRFPMWQLDGESKPYAEIAELHERLGGPWAVYRFLVQPHGELDGLTGREALERRRGKDALEVAESVGRDFR